MTLGNEVVDKIHIDNGEKKEKREKDLAISSRAIVNIGATNGTNAQNDDTSCHPPRTVKVTALREQLVFPDPEGGIVISFGSPHSSN